MSEFEALFVSDVHLAVQQSYTTDAFCAFVRNVAHRAKRVFILGDLFEYWAGDDDLQEPFNVRIVSVLSDLTKSGHQLYFMAGNRDFLVNGDFANATGCTLVEDPYRFAIGNQSILLSHGDSLCVDDVAYQKFRTMVRAPVWQRDFLAKPLSERKALIGNMRTASESAKRAKPADIMDVNEHAVGELLGRFRESILIHGHTHRPALHEWENDSKRFQRWVLPDWDCEQTVCRGGGIVLAEEELYCVDPYGKRQDGSARS